MYNKILKSSVLSICLSLMLPCSVFATSISTSDLSSVPIEQVKSQINNDITQNSNENNFQLKSSGIKMESIADQAILSNVNLSTDKNSQNTKNDISLSINFDEKLNDSTSTWLSSVLSTVEMEGINTSNFTVVDTSEALDMINFKYTSLKKDMDNLGYGQKTELETYKLTDKAASAEDIFQSTYSDIYEKAKNGTLSIKREENTEKTTESANNVTFSLKENDVNTNITTSQTTSDMINSFKEQLNNTYADYVNSDSYKKTYNNISTKNISNYMANMTYVPNTISSSTLSSTLATLSDTVDTKINDMSASNYADLMEKATTIQSEVDAKNNNAAKEYKSMFDNAVSISKQKSGYNDIMNQIFGSKTTTSDKDIDNTYLTFNSQDDLVAYCNAAGYDIDSTGCNDEGEQVVDLTGDTTELYISISEMKANENLYSQYNATVTSNPYTDVVTNTYGGSTYEGLLEQAKAKNEGISLSVNNDLEAISKLAVETHNVETLEEKLGHTPTSGEYYKEYGSYPNYLNLSK